VQYGFRRGVSYDLMQLNPNGTDPLRYAINPVAGPGQASDAIELANVARFMCKGSMWMPTVRGGSLHVSPLPGTAPLAALAAPLNARFDLYDGALCNAYGAPPDFNIKSYAYNVAGGVNWMSPSTGRVAAAATTSRGKLETVADLPTPPAAAGDYGPLWAFAKAVQAPASLTGPEPSAGYTTFATGDWATLYKSGPTTSTYGTTPPYQSTLSSSGKYLAPRNDNLEISTLQRRVLNIPLLSCSPSAPAGENAPASVLAIGKFFMMVPATADRLVGEFAGVLPDTAVPAEVKLFP
jgi:hypothetical protein